MGVTMLMKVAMLVIMAVVVMTMSVHFCWKETLILLLPNLFYSYLIELSLKQPAFLNTKVQVRDIIIRSY